MGKRTFSTLVVACTLLAASSVAGDELMVISDRDNTLYEAVLDTKVTTGSVPQSNGAGQHFFAGRTAGKTPPLRRGLIHFDLSTIPVGSSIDSVELTLNMSQTIAGSTPVSLHRATSDWGEGTSHAPGQEGSGADATPGDATWFHTFFDTDFWTSNGGDFAITSSATIPVDGVAAYTWGSTSGMEADVAAWVDNPAMNFGWVVVGDEVPTGQGGPTAKRFDTREAGGKGPLLQPQLVVNFTLPVPVELQTFDVD